MKLFVLGVSSFFWIFLSPALYSEEVPGQKNYDAKCKSCHGKTGEGNPALAKALKVDPAVLSLKDLKKSDDEWVAIIKEGKGKMPSLKAKLSDDEIKDLVKYIRAFSQK